MSSASELPENLAKVLEEIRNNNIFGDAFVYQWFTYDGKKVTKEVKELSARGVIPEYYSSVRRMADWIMSGKPGENLEFTNSIKKQQ